MSGNTFSIDEELFNNFPAGEAYPQNEKLQAHLLEQYKLYVEMADRISARRQMANSFFLSLNTAIVAFVGYFQLVESVKGKSYFLWSVAIAGIALSYLWYRTIRSYRNLNSVKFKIIQEIEKKLPLSPYEAEWGAIGHGKKPKLYLPVTHIEIVIPWIFLLLHAIVLLRSLPWAYTRQLLYGG